MLFPMRMEDLRAGKRRAIRVALFTAVAVPLALSGAAEAQNNPHETPTSIDPPPLTPRLPPPPPRRADSEQGLTLGLRVGYGFPFGAAASTDDGATKLDRAVTGTIPIEVALGYRFIPRVHAFFAVQYAPGLPNRGPSAACPSEAPCSSYDLRVSLGIEVHILPAFVVDPWVGFGMGYEYFRFTAGAPEQGNAFQGVEYANLHAGVDFRLRRGLRLGPDLTATVSRFDQVQPIPGDLGFSPITNKAFHEWIIVGLRMKYHF